MQDAIEERFQILTLVIVVVTVLVVMFYMMIFINPQVSLNPLKPPTPTLPPAPTLQPTWTPTATNTPTNTPISTNTPIPTATRRLPTRTPRPPTPIPSPYIYRVFQQGCQHSGGTFIEGYVTNGSGEEAGTRVQLGLAPGSNVVQTLITGVGQSSPGHYTFVLRSQGAAPGTYYVWIADANGKPLSDPNAGRVTTNNNPNGDDPLSCWQAKVSFGR